MPSPSMAKGGCPTQDTLGDDLPSLVRLPRPRTLVPLASSDAPPTSTLQMQYGPPDNRRVDRTDVSRL